MTSRPTSLDRDATRSAHRWIVAATTLAWLGSMFLAAPADGVLLGYVHAGEGIVVVDTEAGQTRKIVPWSHPGGPRGAFAISGPPLAVRGRIVFPYAVTTGQPGAPQSTSYLLTLDPDSNTPADVPIPGDVAGVGSFEAALFTIGVSPTGNVAYVTGSLTRADGTSSPAVLGYEVATGAAHVVASDALCDAGAHGTCSNCPCGPLIDFLPSPDGATVYVLRDPTPGPFVQHVQLAIVDAPSGMVRATKDLGDASPSVDRGSARFVSLVDGRLLVAVHTGSPPNASTRVLAVNTATADITESAVVPVDLAAVTADATSERLYGASGSSLVVMTARPIATSYTIPLPHAPTSLPGVSRDGSRVAVTAIVRDDATTFEYHLTTVDVVNRTVVSDMSLPFASRGFSGDAPVLLDGCADADRCFCSAAADCALFLCTRPACSGAAGCTYGDQTCFSEILCRLPLPTFTFGHECDRFRTRLTRLEARAEAALRSGADLSPGTPRRKWISAVLRAANVVERITAAERREHGIRPTCVNELEVAFHRDFLKTLRRLQRHPGTCPQTGG